MSKPANVPPQADYLTMDAIMGGKLTLDELLDAPWASDGRSLRQWFTDALSDAPAS